MLFFYGLTEKTIWRIVIISQYHEKNDFNHDSRSGSTRFDLFSGRFPGQIFSGTAIIVDARSRRRVHGRPAPVAGR